jgi:hypothetical protein
LGKNTMYYLLWPMTDEPATPDPDWREHFLDRFGHPCGHFDFRTKLDDLVLSDVGANGALSFVSPGPGNLVHTDLLNALQIGCESFHFGNVHLTGGREAANLRTYEAVSHVWLRGGPKSYCYRCKTCQQLIYDPMGEWYCINDDVPSEPVFGTHYGGIVVSEEYYSGLSGRRWKGVNVARLPVLNDPIDGFPADLSTLDPKSERRWRA